MSSIKIETFILKFSEIGNVFDLIPIHSPHAKEEAKKHLDFNYQIDLPGLVKITIDDEVVLGEDETTEDIFITWNSLVSARKNQLKENRQDIILLDNVENVYLERQDDKAQFVIEYDSHLSGKQIKRSPSVPIIELFEEIHRAGQELVHFCQNGNLPIDEDSSYYTIIDKLKV
ncbi:hypothetical protein CHH83_15020 [Bacillus sp. 7586-K]|uniref:hypothetical protein n=1 Tax=Metabacillus niabensis TaxID=324854 RepID=UPI000BA6F478|nr:hypothetical protein CHH83_15020 [Bacillus sp. 7586-K]